MSKEIPTPYVWTQQPQMGTAAGAAQDYSTRMNWLSAGPRMIQHVNLLRETRNQLLMRQAALTETPRTVMNPRVWPASMIEAPVRRPMTVALPENELLEERMTNEGMQLAGGGRWPARQNVHRLIMQGQGLQLNEQLPRSRPYRLRSDGMFQLAGGSRVLPSSLSRRNVLAISTAPSVPRSGGIGSWQFVQEFVPTVYLNPYSGPPDTYPDEFIPDYDVDTGSVDGYS